MFPEKLVVGFTKLEGAKKTEDAVTYGPYENVEPLTFD